MLTGLGEAARRWADRTPWTDVYGLARTLLAAGTLGTLLFSSTTALFRPAAGIPTTPFCEGVGRVSLFCVLPSDRLELARWLGIALLLLAASGWRPRLTALPHWWVAFSLQLSATIPDGGDQVTNVLTLLLVPVALTDRRRWHWAPAEPSEGREVAAVVAVEALFVIRVQVAGIYLHSALGKLGVAEWRDGTALYYWLTDPTFGTPMWARDLAALVLGSGLGVAALTWGTLVLEFLLGVALLMPRRRWAPLLAAGLAFHTGIGLFMGLWSFALAMFAALVLYLRPWEQELSFPRAFGVAIVRAARDRLAVGPGRRRSPA